MTIGNIMIKSLSNEEIVETLVSFFSEMREQEMLPINLEDIRQTLQDVEAEFGNPIWINPTRLEEVVKGMIESGVVKEGEVEFELPKPQWMIEKGL